MCRKKFCTIYILLIFMTVFLMGAKVRYTPKRSSKDPAPKGRANYEAMFADGKLRIAVFWGWDHPRDTIMNSFPAFETLNGKKLYYKGKPVLIEIGMITQINNNPKKIFKTALEDPTIDIIVYSGHARYGLGPAFTSLNDIFHCGNGELVEDRHLKPYRILKATSEDLSKTNFSRAYKIIMLNCCDSQGHFRQSWGRRFKQCGANVDLVTVELPVFNLYDHRRVLTFLRDILSFANWKTIKNNYDSEIHKRRNRLKVNAFHQNQNTSILITKQ